MLQTRSIAKRGATVNGGSASVYEPAALSNITAWMMHPGDDQVVAERIHGVLPQKRKPKPEMQRPRTDISGHWDVSIEFFSGKSEHALYLEQDGNWIHRTHRTDVSVR